jgi:crotonobetainyl-CoA:carnitine CoA-transferase CaiB-like acyl-CoA transferase
MRALEDITVVALEHAVAAPFATRQLADLGARVIKVERPGEGDFARHYDARVRGLSSHFVWANRGKQSVALDLKAARAREALGRLLARADVFVQNLGPGASTRLGLDYATLERAHPRLVVCDISGYGDDGPYRDRKAYDLLVQAEAGLLAVTGTPESPCKAGIAIADIAAGMYALAGILAALHERGRTGRGRRVEVTMLDALAEWMGFPLYFGYDGAAAPPRTGAAHATIWPYGPYATADGETLLVAVQQDAEWRRFCEIVVEDPALARDPRGASGPQRDAHRAALDALVRPRLAALSSAELQRRLEAAGLGFARVNDVAGLRAHPQLAARGRWFEVGSEAGPIAALAAPLPADPDPAARIPALGEHTRSVLVELGYDEAAIAAIVEASR